MTEKQTNVVVTGGASGIGLAMAEMFISSGAKVAICDADREAISIFLKNYPSAIAKVADVTDEGEMKSFLDEVEKKFGGADIVCANAGTGGPAGEIDSLSYADWQRCIATNLHGSFLTCRWAAKVMKAQRGGSIILTASTAGQMGYPYRSPYASAKWGIVGLTKTLAMELGSYGIRVNAICPGAVEGERMDKVIEREAAARGVPELEVRNSYVTGVSMKTWVTAQDIAQTALFLSSNAGSKISGQILAVDGNTETLN